MQLHDPKRLGIYFFYDPQGVVDDYVILFLDSIIVNFKEITVIVNGTLGPEGRERLEKIPHVTVIVRENVGFDVWAYKFVIDQLGWSRICTFDELVLMNFTIMGPVNSFIEMFQTMNSRDVDFWGITVHNGAHFDPWGNMPNGQVPIHIQSHFIAVRKSMLVSPEFQNYWGSVPVIESYWDSVSKHEALFTQRFADVGFKWDAYVETSDTVGRIYYPLFNIPIELVQNRNCPVFKRKMFSVGADAFLQENANEIAWEFFEFLSSSGKYDVDLIVSNTTRLASAQAIESTLGLIFTPGNVSRIPQEREFCMAVVVQDKSHAFLAAELLSITEPKALLLLHANGHSGSDCVCAEQHEWVEVRCYETIENWLEDLARFRYGLFLDLRSWDAAFPEGVADSRRKHELASLLGDSISTRLELFQERKFLGLLAPLPSVHGAYFGQYPDEWRDLKEALKGSEYPFISEPNSLPAISASMNYWLNLNKLEGRFAEIARTASSVALKLDETHPANLLYLLLPVVIQRAGSLSGYIAPTDVVSNQLNNYKYFCSELTTMTNVSSSSSFAEFLSQLARSNELSRLSGYSEASAKFEATRSWQVTKPLRAVMRLFRRGFNSE